jgi:CHASE3 domain sensor protein
VTWFRNLSLAKKLYGGFGVVLALLVVVVIIGYSGTNSLSSSAHGVSNVELAQSSAAADIRAAASDMHFSQAQYVMTNGSTHSNYLADRATFGQALAHLQTVVTTTDERSDVARLTAAVATFDSIDGKAYAALRRGDRAAAVALVNGAGNNAADVISAIGKNL